MSDEVKTGERDWTLTDQADAADAERDRSWWRRCRGPNWVPGDDGGEPGDDE